MIWTPKVGQKTFGVHVAFRHPKIPHHSPRLVETRSDCSMFWWERVGLKKCPPGNAWRIWYFSSSHQSMIAGFFLGLLMDIEETLLRFSIPVVLLLGSVSLWHYIALRNIVDWSNLLLYNVLLKLAFRFCPPFVHENIFLLVGDIFSKSLQHLS